jgi:hypothetical protein
MHDFLSAIRAHQHFSGTVRAGRARTPSSHTRSIVAVRGCSVDWIVRSTASI